MNNQSKEHEKENINNFWEKEYLLTYDYLKTEDKINDGNNMKYHKKYFKYLNYDIKNIIKKKQSN